MRLTRASGILLHVTSLPGPFGIGDLGPGAYRFVDFLHRTGQSIWQVLPLGPTGYADSPYQCFSAFAGNPWLVSLEAIAEEGLLTESELAGAPEFTRHEVDYPAVAGFHYEMLRRSFDRFSTSARRVPPEELAVFSDRNRDWLDDYALFMALKAMHRGAAWITWESGLVERQSASIDSWSRKLTRETEFVKYVQFQFSRQWSALKAYANERGVRVLGDMPIFVAHDSADAWAHQRFFHLDARGAPTLVAGVPPDYFCPTGQLWGNPLYRWDTLAADGYQWWASRVRHALTMFDIVRLDHFRGFEAYWEVPAGEPTAIRGRWVKGPGAELFQAIESQLGELPIVAEDLGLITPEVEALRDQLGFPGMRVLQFAFSDDPGAQTHRPHRYPPNCVVYTGTHDNDTAVGWFRSQPGRRSTRTPTQVEKEREFALRYLGSDGREIHWDLIRAAWSSVADLAIAPLQDLLGLGSEARMNTPGTTSGNWRWRYVSELLTPAVEDRLAELTALYDRGSVESSAS